MITWGSAMLIAQLEHSFIINIIALQLVQTMYQIHLMHLIMMDINAIQAVQRMHLIIMNFNVQQVVQLLHLSIIKTNAIQAAQIIHLSCLMHPIYTMDNALLYVPTIQLSLLTIINLIAM